MSRIALIALTIVALACGEEPTVAKVTVTADNGVPELSRLRITVGGETETVPGSGSVRLPTSFTITVPDGTTNLQVTVEGLDQDDLVRGFGREDVSFEVAAQTNATVNLKSADFQISPDAMSEFRLASEAPAGGGYQAATLGSPDDDQALVVFTNGAASCTGTCIGRARVYDDSGTPVPTVFSDVGDSFAVVEDLGTQTDDVQQTVVAAGEGEAMVAYYGGAVDHVFARGFATADWSFRKEAVADQISDDLGSSRQDTSIARVLPDTFAIVWTEVRSGSRRVMSREVSTLGVPVDVPRELSTDAMVQRPAVAPVGSGADYVVAWRAFGVTPNIIKAAFVSASMGIVASEIEVDSAGVISAIGLLGRDDGTAVAAWAQGGADGNAYEMVLFNSAAGPIAAPIVIAERSGSAASRPDLVATSATEIAVVYQNCPSECDIYMRRFRIDNNGFEAVGDEVRVPADPSGDQRDPSISAINSGGEITSVLVVWTESADGVVRVEGRVVPLDP
ncbi:MAG: hypothetical protein KJO07_18245 [Deltaproteobacteria bacterium]|nr:hypothetical protein [Deltaproteobacteria bacterium]